MIIYSDLTKNTSLGLRSLADFIEKGYLKNIEYPKGNVVVFANNIEFYFSRKNEPIPETFTKEDLKNIILECFDKINEDYNELLYTKENLEEEISGCKKWLVKVSKKSTVDIVVHHRKLEQAQSNLSFVENNILCFNDCKKYLEQKNIGIKIWFYKTKYKNVKGYKVFLMPFFISDKNSSRIYFKMYKHRKEKYINDMFTREIPSNAYFVKFMPFEK